MEIISVITKDLNLLNKLFKKILSCLYGSISLRPWLKQKHLQDKYQLPIFFIDNFQLVSVHNCKTGHFLFSCKDKLNRIFVVIVAIIKPISSKKKSFFYLTKIFYSTSLNVHLENVLQSNSKIIQPCSLQCDIIKFPFKYFTYFLHSSLLNKLIKFTNKNCFYFQSFLLTFLSNILLNIF